MVPDQTIPTPPAGNTEDVRRVPNPGVSGIRVATVAAGFLPVLAVALRTITTPDFWMRLATGRYIAANGIPRTDVFLHGAAEQPWVNTAWLYDRILFQLWRWGGAPLVILLHAALLLAAVALLAKLARRWATPPAIGLALVVSAWILFPPFTIGPALPGFFFAALFAYILRNGPSPRRHLPLLIPLQILWTQLGPGFLMGPAIAALAIPEIARTPAGLRRTRRSGGTLTRSQQRLLCAASLLAATCVNPFFLAAHRTALRLLHTPPPQTDLGLISPLLPWFDQTIFVYFFILSLPILALGVITHKGRLPTLFTAVAFGSAFAAFRDIGALPYYAVLSIPFMALSLQATGETVYALVPFRHTPRWAGRAIIGVPIALGLGSAVWIGSGTAGRAMGHLSRPGLSADSSLFPLSFEHLVSESSPSTVPVFHLPFDAGPLAWTLPGAPLFSDSRRERYSAERATFLRELLGGNPDAMPQLEQTFAPSLLVVSCLWPGGAPFVRRRLEDQSWTLKSFDGVTAVLKRMSTSPNTEPELLAPNAAHAAYARLETDIRDAQNRLAQGQRPAFSPRLIGAALLFSAVEQDAHVLELLDIIQAMAPRMAHARLLRGISLFRLGRPEEALPWLELYTRRNPSNPQGWFWLSHIHRALGNESEARRAAERSGTLTAPAESPPRE